MTNLEHKIRHVIKQLRETRHTQFYNIKGIKSGIQEALHNIDMMDE